MNQDRNEELSEDLHRLLGDDGFLALTEEFGGQRPYLPLTGGPVSDRLVDVLGEELAQRVLKMYAGSLLHVPIARAFRARQYRAAGDSDAEIARKLTMTVSAVERLFARNPAPRSRKSDPRQLGLFDT